MNYYAIGTERRRYSINLIRLPGILCQFFTCVLAYNALKHCETFRDEVKPAAVTGCLGESCRYLHGLHIGWCLFERKPCFRAETTSESALETRQQPMILILWKQGGYKRRSMRIHRGMNCFIRDSCVMTAGLICNCSSICKRIPPPLSERASKLPDFISSFVNHDPQNS